jgi:predicted nucleic acid-binding protein
LVKIGRAGDASVVVIDASVVVEFLVRHEYTVHADLLFDELADPESTLQLWAPDLLFAESASALRKLVLLKAIGANAATTAVDRLGRLPIATTGTAGLLTDAWKMRHNVTIYDACYLALAERLGAPFVTADEHLVRSRRGKGVQVVSLSEIG